MVGTRDWVQSTLLGRNLLVKPSMLGQKAILLGRSLHVNSEIVLGNGLESYQLDDKSILLG